MHEGNVAGIVLTQSVVHTQVMPQPGTVGQCQHQAVAAVCWPMHFIGLQQTKEMHEQNTLQTVLTCVMLHGYLHHMPRG